MKKTLSRRTLDVDCRDAHGFTVRPQHLQTYREYATIYKEEEEERSHKWRCFLEQQAEPVPHLAQEDSIESGEAEATSQQIEPVSELTKHGDNNVDDDNDNEVRPVSSIDKETGIDKDSVDSQKNSHQVLTWADISASLRPIDHVMSLRVEKRRKLKNDQIPGVQNNLDTIKEGDDSAEQSERECDEESCDVPLDDVTNIRGDENQHDNDMYSEQLFPWKELEFLVHGGVPRYLRGELWQAFVGARTRRMESYYQGVPDPESDTGGNLDNGSVDHSDTNTHKGYDVPEIVRKQIEKDLPRTFPGHAGLDEKGRCRLRRVLLAYARHNPSVGYCQAMNFFAGLLLLMMPEENAFWTLVGIIDDYFEGCYSQEMTESQVDQLVFEELMRERFPKLVSHLDYLGVQVTWISGPWFLSIFVNMLPWESVLRVWDVLLFEGNRVMLFRTALALMELYGPAIGTTKDAADAICLLQSLAGSTFDSSQLVLTACMGFLNVTEDRLQGLRDKHRPSVIALAEERSKGARVLKDPKGLATKLYSFKKDKEKKEPILEKACSVKLNDSDAKVHSTDLVNSLAIDSEIESPPDLQEQVVWLKVEMSKLIEESRSATLRAEELETALMEMVQQDNRLQLSARVEQLEQELTELRQVLADKMEQEKAMLQVLMRVEQEQKLTEDARVFAEQESADQKHALQILQEKYDKAMASLAEVEKRAVMAESMLEATVQYESGQAKATSPRPTTTRSDSSGDNPVKRTGLLSFGMGWRDKNKEDR